MLTAVRGKGAAPFLVLGLLAAGCATDDRIARTGAGLGTGARPPEPTVATLERVDRQGRRAVWLRVEGGTLGVGTAARIIDELRATKAVGLVVDSTGGLVEEARTLGYYLRANGLHVAVDRTCLSACIDLLAGGRERLVAPSAKLGVHQSHIPDGAGTYAGGQYSVAESYRYLRAMGIDAELAINAAMVPPHRLLVIDIADAIKLGLVTAVEDLGTEPRRRVAL